MPRDRSVVEAALQKKGFEGVSGKGRAHDHRFYRYFSNGSPVPGVVTKVSSGTSYKTLSDNLIGEMAKQCKLARSQFLQLVDCPLSQQQYETILRADGVIDEEDLDNAG